MSRYLLLGAGFSANWGGWLANEVFEYLIGRPAVTNNPRLKKLLWEHQLKGSGFEGALADLKQSEQFGEFADLTNAVETMFSVMNKALINVVLAETANHDAMKQLRYFLGRFDAIFTLNQDVLIEALYYAMFNSNPQDEIWQRWPGRCGFPGMEAHHSIDYAPGREALSEHSPTGRLTIDPRMQPVYKLHGSSNWKADGQSMLILGGAKAQTIAASPILAWYSAQFQEALSRPSARLMVVGYGFRDEHVNTIIQDAVAKGLQFFVNDPDGAGLAANLSPTRARNQIICETDLERMFLTGLIGASRRKLREILAGNEVEIAKLEEFLA